MLLRLVRTAPALARLRPALERALPPTDSCLCGCLHPKGVLEPEALVDQEILQNFREIWVVGREITQRKSH